jgi:hypothetical protein
MPQNPLDFFGNDGHQYGAWIFNEYLSVKYDNDIIREIWDTLDPDDSNNSSIDAIESVMRKRGSSLKDTLLGFWAKNYQKDSFYEEGKEWGGGVAIENDLSPHIMSSEDTVEQSLLLYHLGARLFKFVPNSSVSADKLKLEVDIKENIGAIAIAKFSDGTYKEYPFRSANSVYIPNFTSSKIQEVVLIIANYGKTMNEDEIITKYRGVLTQNSNIYDLNSDGVVNDLDIDEVVQAWGIKKGDLEYNSSYDFDNSGEITVVDIMKIVNQVK